MRRHKPVIMTDMELHIILIRISYNFNWVNTSWIQNFKSF